MFIKLLNHYSRYTGDGIRLFPRWQKLRPMLKQRWLLGCNKTLGQRHWRDVGPMFHINIGPMLRGIGASEAEGWRERKRGGKEGGTGAPPDFYLD